MSISVLIVDDSSFFRRRLVDIIGSNPQFTVAGTASNGREAIEKNEQLRPDVITMDYEMPVMDGITAVQRIMASRPTPILMFSSLTYEGARVTLDALDAGAVDFLPKNFEEISKNTQKLKRTLQERIIAVARSGSRLKRQDSITETRPPVVRPATRSVRVSHPQVIVIGTSTGGPVALQKVLSGLPGHFKIPIILIQHMPGTFTKAFAERLNQLCPINVVEARDGDLLKPGQALLAPGGMQLIFDRQQHGRVKVLAGDDRLNYKPSVDITFASAAATYGSRVLAIVLTGMGADGCDGARLLKEKEGTVWAQDEASCVIYGMPAAVAKAGYVDEVVKLSDIAPRLARI